LRASRTVASPLGQRKRLVPCLRCGIQCIRHRARMSLVEAWPTADGLELNEEGFRPGRRRSSLQASPRGINLIVTLPMARPPLEVRSSAFLKPAATATSQHIWQSRFSLNILDSHRAGRHLVYIVSGPAHSPGTQRDAIEAGDRAIVRAGPMTRCATYLPGSTVPHEHGQGWRVSAVLVLCTRACWPVPPRAWKGCSTLAWTWGTPSAS